MDGPHVGVHGGSESVVRVTIGVGSGALHTRSRDAPVSEARAGALDDASAGAFPLGGVMVDRRIGSPP